MITFRRHRLITLLFAMVSLLFMQFAVARYVCPSEMAGATESSLARAHDGMPCAASMPTAMDDEQTGLCQAHCQADQQSADTYIVPVLLMLPAITYNFAQVDTSQISQGVTLQAPLLKRTTAPPLSVRNCCFRT